MKQLVHIHGGATFANYEDCLTYLSEYVIDNPSPGPKGRWRYKYQEFLGDNWQIIMPEMPNARNVQYAEWVIWFEKYVPYFKDGIVLVGHSLGGAFITKYLSENTLPVKIKQLHLVAAVHGETVRADAFKVQPLDLANILKQCDDITIYQSTDDKVVQYPNAEKYIQDLPKAKFVKFKDRGHFLQPEFPELVANILKPHH